MLEFPYFFWSLTMNPLFVTATNTNVGKTYTTLKLIESFSKEGISVGVCKPIETGVITEPLDAKALLDTVKQYNSAFQDLTPRDITAYTFKLPAAPFCADKTQIIRIEKIKTKILELQKLCDLLIIEGAGGLMVPITKEYRMIDLAKDLNLKTLLVTPSKLGCINDTLLSMEALKKYDIPFDWCVNLFEDKHEFNEVTKPYYDAVFTHWWCLDKGIKSFTLKTIEES
ncbi:MAG: Dethiobiotin synthetase (EC [uncultured Sulfurovum sp.]|uniref:ATP-dependent dethiobiotin synthetase BioD n=1 Tax=uncultured Sulfurovum sp. TaxID=269237 RepID=A0A6S6T2D4_9BACT|nr:MAG: Dethiobiotin synthetase (EC [uncultured Sulfurovum sp.]